MDKNTFLSFRPAVLPVTVPGRPGPVFLRVMSGAERMAWFQISGEKDRPANKLSLALLARTISDEHGVRLFGDGDDDLVSLGNVDALTLDALAKESLRFNGLNDEGQEDAKKNSSTPPSDSSSGSPVT